MKSTILVAILFFQDFCRAFQQGALSFSQGRSLVVVRSSTGSSITRPENEFSRLIDPERVLRIKRDYVTDIEATPEECQALAERFELPNIGALKASLSLRKEMSGSDGIEAEGTITGTVTRTCVRTNEAFVLNDLEIPLYSIVRPVTPIAALAAQQQALEDQLGGLGQDEQKSKTRKSSYRPQDRNMDEMDILQLQRLLQSDINVEDDVLMEDEAIYSTDGTLDVGELVAQLFWLSLDPYPKKPGSDPVQISISG